MKKQKGEDLFLEDRLEEAVIRGHSRARGGYHPMSLSNQNLCQEDQAQPSPGEEASVNRFLALAQESADVFWLLTPTGHTQEISSSWQTFTGQQESNWQGKGWLDALHPADQPRVEETLIQAVTSGRTGEMKCQIRRYDGVYRLMHLRIIPVRVVSGAICEIVVCGNDITRQESVEQMNDAQVQLAVKAFGVGTWDWDLITNQIIWTDQCKVLLGEAPDTPIDYKGFLTALHPDDRERVDLLIAHALAEHTEYQAAYRVIWPDGSLHWLIDRGKHLYDLHDKPTHMIGCMIDITDVKQKEEQLQEVNRSVTVILESITDGFFHVDTQWRLTYLNRKAEEIAKKKREGLLGQRLWDIHLDFLDMPIEHQLWEAMATRQEVHFDAWGQQQQCWFEFHVYPAQDGLSVYFRDITERKHGEEALRESEMRFHGLVESNIIGIVVSDPEGNIYEANEAFLSLVGYTCEDLAAGRMNWIKITPPEDLTKSLQTVEELLTTGRFQPLERDYLTKDGKRVPVLMGGTFFRREGPPPLLLAFVLDLTARKEMERQKDLFLGMTSHELKTPLAALKGTFQLLQRRLKRMMTTADLLSSEWSAFVDYLTKSLETSLRQVDIQTRLINDLLDVSRITARTLDLSLQRCDLATLVRETVEDLRVITPERPLLLDLPEHTVVHVLADRDRISQVVTNYVTNALRYSSLTEPVHIGLTVENDVARVWVQDRGPGISKEAQKDIWQRFHQVKGVAVQSKSNMGKGLGLGLYICQMLIMQHQGEVGVESAPGEGSTFWFTLPVVT